VDENISVSHLYLSKRDTITIGYRDEINTNAAQ